MAVKTRLPYKLYKRGEIYHAYYSFVEERKRIQLRETTGRTTLEDAERFAIQRIAELQKKARQQTTGELPCITVDEAFGLFYQTHAQHYARPAETLRKLGLIQKHIKVQYLHEIDSAEIMDYIQRRRPYVSNGTINRELVILSSLLTQCRLMKYKTSDVRPGKFKLQEPAENIKYIPDLETARKIISRAASHLKPIIYTALYTGFRRHNVLTLKWENIDFINNVITVKVKDRTKQGGKNHPLPMIAELKEILLSLPRINEYVFNYHGQPISDIKHSWHSIFYDKKGKLKDPSLPYINFHTLRHTTATWTLKKTHNLKLTQKVMGHASMTTTNKYAHVLDDEIRDALADVFK